MIITRYAMPPIITTKQACLLTIPVLLLWGYLLYVLFTNNSSKQHQNLDRISHSVNLPDFADHPTILLINGIEATINQVRILRIFRHLGGEYNKNLIITIKKRHHGTLSNFITKKKSTCKSVPDSLEGRLRPDLSPHNLSLVVPSPLPCVSRHKVAIVIPYRDREEHLIALLNTLHPLLQRQQINYRIYVVEQFGNDTFNKGVLMNAGVRESLKDLDFHCFVFHDVDLIPEDDRNMYTCPYMPRHMSVAVDKFNYSLPYTMLVGGVFSIRLEHFLTVNGYSNLYWGWGGEDDDMAYRIKYRKLEIIRPPETIARYSMIKHEHRPESPNAIRTALLRMAKKRSSRDGLNTVKYRVVWRHDSLSHTHLMIDIGRNHRWHFMDSQQRLIINF